MSIVTSQRTRPIGLGLILLLAVSTGCDDEPGVVLPDASVDGPAISDTNVPVLNRDGSVDGVSPDSQSDASPVAAERDIDMVFARLDTNGKLDSKFGANGTGIAILNLSGRSGNVFDSPYGVSSDALNRLVVFGRAKATTMGRNDADRVVVRLSTDGLLDKSFAKDGVHTLNILGLTDNARHGFVQASDGAIVASGYIRLPTLVGDETANSIVLLRLDGTGKPDATFGRLGIVTSNPFRQDDPTKPSGTIEAYSVALQSPGKYVTTGYGREADTNTADNTVDILSVRYNADGTLDKSWGQKGVHTLDVATQNDRGRDLRVLQDGRVLIVGSGSLAKGDVDALVAILSVNGELDKSFNGMGYQLWDVSRPDSAFHAAAVSADGKLAAAVGYSTGGTGNDDGLVGLIPLDATGPAIVKPDPISASAKDRYAGAAFAADGKLYAVGSVNETANDSAMVVVRFNRDGTRDASFGVGGVAKINVALDSGVEEAGTALVVQADGMIVVAGTAEAK